ncbi:MAG: hypothetical protein IKA96_06300 [Alistipes sp.]|nr:hypothetical protein [Alistipes sp.]
MLSVKDRITEIYRLIVLHFRENWLLALCLIGLFTAITAFNYIVPAIDTPIDYIAKWDIRHYKDIRESTLLLFLIVIAWYSLAAMFKGFARRQRLHDTLMLPARRTSRFVAEMIAVLIVIPAILVAIWTAIDAADIICHGFPAEYHSMNWFWNKDMGIYFGFSMALIFSIHSLITLWRASHKKWLCIGICVFAFLMLLASTKFSIYYPFTYGNLIVPGPRGNAIDTYANISGAGITTEELGEKIQLAFFGLIPIELYALSLFSFKERNTK